MSTMVTRDDPDAARKLNGFFLAAVRCESIRDIAAIVDDIASRPDMDISLSLSALSPIATKVEDIFADRGLKNRLKIV